MPQREYVFKTYSFRAEYQYDALKFLLSLTSLEGVFTKITAWFNYEIGADVAVEISSTIRGIEGLIAIAKTIPDCHVIEQTIRQCSMNENSMERDRTRN